MNIIEEIAAHEREISTGKLPADLQLCPKCNESHSNFKIHDYKERIFLVVEKDVVHRIESFLSRWKCLLCGKTFIEYPSFALPNKRYTVSDILGFSHFYGATPDTSYQETAQHEGMPIGHIGEGSEEGRRLAASTIWRWISFLGSLCQTTRNCIHFIMQKNPSSDIARRLYLVLPQKYRSCGRKTLLQQCLHIIDGVAEYKSLFGIFPQFAIRGSVN